MRPRILSALTLLTFIGVVLGADEPKLPRFARARLGGSQTRGAAEGFASASRDGRVLLVNGEVWDTTTGQLLSETKDAPVGLLAPDGKTFVASTASSALTLVDATTGKVVRALEAPEGLTPYVLVGSFDGESFAAGAVPPSSGVAETTLVWSVKTGKIRARLASPAVSISSDGTFVGMQSKRDRGTDLVRFDAAGNETSRIFLEGTKDTPCVGVPPLVSRDGRFVVVPAQSRRQVVHDPKTGKKLFELPHETWPLAFTPKGELVVARASCIVVVEGNETRCEIKGTFSNEIASANGERVVAITPEGLIHVHDTKTGAFVNVPPASHGHRKGPLVSLAFSPDGKTLATAAEEETVLWDLETRKPRASLENGGRVAFSPDGKLLAAMGEDNGNEPRERTLRLFSVSGAPTIARVVHVAETAGDVGEPHLESPFAFLPDGTLLTGGCQLVAWDPKTGEPSEGPGDARHVEALAVAPDGAVAVAQAVNQKQTGDEDASPYLSIWKEKKEISLGRFAEKNGAIVGLAFSSDGKWLLAAGTERLLVWERATGKREERKLRGPATFSPGGKLIAALAAEGGPVKVVLADAATGEILRTCEGFAGIVAALAFSPDGETLATLHEDRTAILWEVPAR